MKVLAFIGMPIGGRATLRPVLRFIAASGAEVLTAATLQKGSALLMADAGAFRRWRSAFIAGVAGRK